MTATLLVGGMQTVVSQPLSKLVENHLILLLVPVTPPAAPYYSSEYSGSYTGSSGSSEGPCTPNDPPLNHFFNPMFDYNANTGASGCVSG